MFLTPFLHQSASVVAIISQMITPAIFILASGNLVMSSMTRVARIVDRVRALVDARAKADAASEEFANYTDDLRIYSKRSRLLENALTYFYTAIACFVVSSLLIAISVVIPDLVFVPTIVTIVGAVLVLAGSTNSLLEVRLASGMVRNEIKRADIGPGA